MSRALYESDDVVRSMTRSLRRGKLSFPAGILNFESSCGVCDG